MRGLLPALVLVALSGCTTAQVTEPPQEQPRPIAGREGRGQGPTAESVQAEAERQIAQRLGAEALRQGREAITSIMVAAFRGAFASSGPAVKMAVRDSTGWKVWNGSGSAELPGAASRELDRLLANRSFQSEAPFWPATDCPDAGATLMVIRHKGQVRVTRQSCGFNGLIGRVSQIVLGEAVPS